jgi:hypothetical protein
MAKKALAALLAIAASVFGQQRIIQLHANSSPLPDYWKYHLVFRTLESYERVAQKKEAEGKAAAAAAWRALYQHKAGLTESEAATLQGVAASCQGQEQAELTKAQPFIAQLRGLLYSPDASLAPAGRGAQITQVRGQLKQLDQERVQILQGCISTLQASLGPASFKKLDAFVQKESARHDRLLSPGAPAKAPLGSAAAPAGANQ